MKLHDLVITKEEDIIQPTGSLVLEDVSQDAHILGSAVQLEDIKPNAYWGDIEIQPEIQRVKDGDLYNCTNNAITNAWELIYKLRYGVEVNWSELYSAKITGTIPGRGNSFENVFEIMRKKFCAWEDEFPTERDKTIAENYAKVITKELEEKVEKRGEGYEKRYQFLGSRQDDWAYNDALKKSPVTVAVEGRYVWKNGTIVNTGGSYNHAVVYLGKKDGKKIVLDSESLQVLPFAENYKFVFPAVHSIKKKNMVQTYKKHGDPTICVKVEGEDSMMAFASGDLAGGKLFKSLYGVDDYKALPRIYVEEWTYPIDYWIYANKIEQGENEPIPIKIPQSFWEKLNFLFK